MPFTTAELYRLKAELGFNLLSNDASPYIGITAWFDTVVNDNIASEVATTSSTTVTAATSYTPVALTLASATGFAVGARVCVDVDSRAEWATIQSLAATVATVQLKGAHSGTYPVVLDGPIPIARECLRRIDEVKREMAATFGTGQLKAVDEVSFYQAGSTRTLFGNLGQQLTYWRNELGAALGIAPQWSQSSGCGSLSVY
jgi:hypothetical protein